MEPRKMSERNRRQLEAMPAEKRVKIKAVSSVRNATPKRAADGAALREPLDREARETGAIAARGGDVVAVAREAGEEGGRSPGG